MLTKYKCYDKIKLQMLIGGDIMKTIGNILWLVLTGLWAAIAWVILGAIWCITIIGIPFGKQCFKLAMLAVMPFGATVSK